MSEYKYPKRIKLKMIEKRNSLEDEFKKDGASDEELTILRLCFESGFLEALSAIKEEELLK